MGSSISRAAFIAAAIIGCGDASVGSPWGDEAASELGGPAPSASGAQSGAATPAVSGSSSVNASPPPTSTGSFRLALGKASAELELRAKATFAVTVTPEAGFKGAVGLWAKGLPGGAAATFKPSTVDISGGPQMATLTIETASSAVVGSANVEIGAATGASTATSTLSLSVKPAITIAILSGEKSMPDGMGFGGGPIELSLLSVSEGSPVTVNFRNDDTLPHRIHANGNSGFEHGKDAIAPSGLDVPRKITSKGDYEFYLHDESPAHLTILKIK